MKPDNAPEEGAPPETPPPASLSEVSVKRRRSKKKASAKPGDLTQEPAEPTALRTEPSSAAPVPAQAAQPAHDRPAPPPLDEEAVRRLLDPPERRAAAAPPAPSRAEPQRIVAQAPTVAEPPPVDRELRHAAPPPSPPPPNRVEPQRAVAQAQPTVAQPRLTVDPDERQAAPPPPPELRLVAEAPAAQAKAPPAEAKPAQSSVDEIIDYWDSLRGDRAFPPLDTLDRSLVGKSWPNTLLVGFGEATTPRLTRLGAANDDIEYTEMVIHWILSRAQQAARRSEPMEEEKRFPVSRGQARYQLLLLPLGTAQGKSEQVLCHLCRGKEVSRSAAFKRWLAS